MRINIYIIILISFLYVDNIYSQDPPRPRVIVENIQVICTDTTYLPQFDKRSRRGRSRSKKNLLVNNYIYKLEITIKLDGQIFNFPLAITCHYPKGETRTIIVNQNQSIIPIPKGLIEFDELFDFPMLIMTNIKGEAKISLAEWDDQNLNIINESKIIFEDFIFTLQ